MNPKQSFIPEPWLSSDRPALNWLYATGSIEQALAYAQLFWPEFVEHEDCVFLKCDLVGYSAWITRLPTKADVEAMINHRHILDLFDAVNSSAPHEWLISLGLTLKECWKAKLNSQFPTRNFEIVFDQTLRPDPVDYQITFYQKPVR
jgi:hypothetical protein